MPPDPPDMWMLRWRSALPGYEPHWWRSLHPSPCPPAYVGHGQQGILGSVAPSMQGCWGTHVEQPAQWKQKKCTFINLVSTNLHHVFIRILYKCGPTFTNVEVASLKSKMKKNRLKSIKKSSQLHMRRVHLSRSLELHFDLWQQVLDNDPREELCVVPVGGQCLQHWAQAVRRTVTQRHVVRLQHSPQH